MHVDQELCRSLPSPPITKMLLVSNNSHTMRVTIAVQVTPMVVTRNGSSYCKNEEQMTES